MRDAIAYHLFSGHAWFTAGAVLIVIALADLMRLFTDHPRLAAVARVTGLVACAIAALSGTPIPHWLAIVALAAVAALLFVTIASHRIALRVAGAGSTLIVVMIAMAWEVPHHRGPPAKRLSSRPLIVIGDSLSSGGFGEKNAWPEIVASSRRVTNLARPSDTASLALRDSLPLAVHAAPVSVILVEIGGNDMLDGTPAGAFQRDLAALVGAVSNAAAAHRDVIMLELPVLPGKWSYGAAQRRVARDANAVLVPKCVLARVLTHPANTSDGLHLTQRGHDELARAIAPWIP